MLGLWFSRAVFQEKVTTEQGKLSAMMSLPEASKGPGFWALGISLASLRVCVQPIEGLHQDRYVGERGPAH